MTVYPTREGESAEGVEAAVAALGRGALVVLPTDTVYGVAANAFDAAAVEVLQAAKGRGRDKPPPVLVGSLHVLDALATDLSDAARALAEAFWPGGLTLVARAQPALSWDLGETRGTVGLRMPDHPVALDVLRRFGPTAVTSANRTGEPAPSTCDGAREQLGGSVAVYLDAGEVGGGVASTVLDVTGPTVRVLREGAISREELATIVPELGEGHAATP
ncbi:TsaC protein (YrdC domain) required for threonylcarbamoyladenosine t(6)A37 modification in tRNA [Actinomycetales bacterium JB111]|nr:TsaC protein (YrdC domain) required for threonylcarbamoyladenosine t(6)A37 modification in tRNA [Actinomycetales bacterium JB111]